MNEATLVLAHVKWFTQAPVAQPETPGRVLTPYFLGALGLAPGVALLLAWLNVPLQELPRVRRIHAWLERQQPLTPWIIRLGMAVPLLYAGAGGYLLHFELHPIPGWVMTAQIVLGLLLLIPRADRFAAAGVMALVVPGALQFGLHPLIDYISWVGTSCYPLTRGTRPWP